MAELVANFTLSAGEEFNAIFKIETNGTYWGQIEGDITNQTDLNNLINSKVGEVAGDLTLEETARINADTVLQGNIDTLSGTVSNNYNTLDGKIGDNTTAINNHKADKNNPHAVTKAQVGLGNVDNTSDADKPISTAVQNALNGKANTSDLSTVATTGDYDDLLNKPTIPTVNDATLTIQKNGTDVATFTANSSTNQTANITVPTQASDIGALPDTTTINDLTTEAQQNALNSGATTTNIGQIATNTQDISDEITNRQNADNNLQSQIDAITSASDVTDIVGTYAELQAYDTTSLPDKSIIKVLQDESHNDETTYYRWVITNGVGAWVLIGEEGPYYTKSQADSTFVPQTRTINGYSLDNNVSLSASDVNAMPDSTTIGNGTLTIQKNGTTIDTFGANDTGNTTVNITVPTDTSDLTNGAGYITGITSSDVTTALGYTPYNSTNPDGYTNNVGTVTSVNNTQPDANGNVTLSIPAAQVQSNWTESDNTSKAYIQNKPNLSTVATTGDYDDLTNKPTIPTVGNGTITINQGGVQKGTFTTNQSGNTTIDLTAGSSTDVQINGTSIVSNNVANIVTEGTYNASTNKIATMSDVPTDTSDLTNGAGYTTNVGTVTSVNNVSPVNGNVSLTIPQGTVKSVNNTSPDSNGNVSISIPTVNNPTITFQKNGSTVESITLNQSSNETINITVPTNTNELTNGAGFITSSALSGYQTTSNLVTSVSSQSTDSQYPSAKLFYDTCGDIETLINAL